VPELCAWICEFFILLMPQALATLDNDPKVPGPGRGGRRRAIRAPVTRGNGGTCGTTGGARSKPPHLRGRHGRRTARSGPSGLGSARR
jgi:hypothetical protein